MRRNQIFLNNKNKKYLHFKKISYNKDNDELMDLELKLDIK